MFTSLFLPSIKRVWRAKASWYIALLVLTPLTIINEWGLIVRIYSGSLDPIGYFWYLADIREFLFGPTEFFATITANPGDFVQLIFGLVLGLTLLFFIAWVIMNAQAILIYTQSPQHEQKRFTLQQALEKVERLWIPLLQLNLSLVLLRILSISFLFILAKQLSELVFFIVMLIVLVGMTLFSFSVRITLFKVILEHKSIKQGLIESGKLIKKHVASCYELSFILYLLWVIITIAVLYIAGLLITEFQLGVTIISIFLLDAGPVPYIVISILGLILATIIGFVALLNYSVWLTWYTETTRTGVSHSLVRKGITFIRIHVFRAKIN